MDGITTGKPIGVVQPIHIATRIGNHRFRATGLAAYLKNGGTLEKAAQVANQISTRTTHRRADEASIERSSA